MGFSAVLFDMDGVIADTEALHVDAFEQTLGNHGYELSSDEYERYFAGKSDVAGFKDYFGAIQEPIDLSAIMTEKAQTYLGLATSRLEPYPGAIALIHELVAKKIKLGMVSGSLSGEVALTLKRFGLVDYFSVIISADSITNSKPDPEGYIAGLHGLSVMANDCIIIEDSPSGLKAAIAAGVRCVCVTHTHEAIYLPGATLILDQFTPGCLDTL